MTAWLQEQAEFITRNFEGCLAITYKYGKNKIFKHSGTLTQRRLVNSCQSTLRNLHQQRFKNRVSRVSDLSTP
jgi:hypothetical protein